MDRRTTLLPTGMTLLGFTNAALPQAVFVQSNLFKRKLLRLVTVSLSTICVLSASVSQARSTLLAGSVRDCAIDLSFAVSSSPSDNSIARRHAALTSPRSIVGLRGLYRSPKIQMNPFIVTTFMESVV
jgi:hypothetical protein